jgi:hypothetical protein
MARRCSPANTAIVPVKTGASSRFKVESTLVQQDITLVADLLCHLAYNWVPLSRRQSQAIALYARVGQVAFRNSIDSATTVSTGQTAFFGDANRTQPQRL